MLDATLSTYVEHIDQYCDSPEQIADHVCDLYERLLNLERAKKETTKLLAYKRRANTFMTEVIELARPKQEFRIGQNRKKLDEAYWLSFFGQMFSVDDSTFSSRDSKYIDNIEQNIKESSLKSKCLMYWIIHTFNADWMPVLKQWMFKENLFVCEIPHDLVLRDLRISEATWLSFWFSLKFNSELFDQYIKQRTEEKGTEISEETLEQIVYIKKLRP